MTRSKLLESARQLADTKSVPEFTVEDIASGAEVSRAAFYMYFDNKLAICEEVARTTQAGFIDMVTSFKRDADIRSTIQAGVRAYVDGFRSDRPGMRMTYELAYAETTIRELVHDTRTVVYQLWEHEFDRAVETGQCPPLDVPLVSRLVVGMLETFCVRTMRTEEYSGTSVADRDPVETISDLWCRALQIDF
ncbi:TetR/AcrR family transcriptional regulator [Nonomuraea sp. NPDC005650]|uniref:TetR/AcrR family transcriptional regulator n=1 Tax=Nonomuraea sp. NPDC005650 TaxID=3157045 RepID=UPI0033B5E443